MNRPKIILLDTFALLFRAYYSIRSHQLTNNDGFPTGAMFGTINQIKSLAKTYPDADMVAAFDAPGKSFRHEIFPAYKANRKPPEEELTKQITPLIEIIQAMGLPNFCVDGVEADDIIATIATQATEQHIPILIASSDKDLYQLINDYVKQIDHNGDIVDDQYVLEKFGVHCHQIKDLLSLWGDASDNIPGIAGVGKKTAANWLQAYDSVENIKKNAEHIKGKVGDNLRANFEALELSSRLVALKKDVDIVIDFDHCQPKPDIAKLKELYQKYDFRKWSGELSDTTRSSVAPSNVIHQISKEPQSAVVGSSTQSTDVAQDSSKRLAKYHKILVQDHSVFESMIDKIKQQKCFVFDTETTSLDYLQAKLVGLVFLLGKMAYYLPVGHRYVDVPMQLDLAQVLDMLKPIFERDDIQKIGQNLKYDAHVLANYDIHLRGIAEDTMLQSHCLNSAASAHNLDNLAMLYLQHTTIKYQDVTGKGKKQINFEQVPLDQALDYATEDVIITAELYHTLQAKLSEYPKLQSLYQQLELPFIEVLLLMERTGVQIDTAILAQQQQSVRNKLEQLKQKIYQITGADNKFNLDSPKQLRHILFDASGLNLKPARKTLTGQASTNEEALRKLDHPVGELLLEYRMLSKLDSTYLEALPKQINPKTQRIHTSYHQAGTVTGRLSSANPNLQNIPIRTEEGAKIRRAFIARPGYQILAADYSQIELRLMAHLSKDTRLVSAFQHDADIHVATAAQMFQLDETQITPEQRRHAKAINFGLMYGMGAHSLAKQLNCTNKKAQQMIEQYFANYPQVKDYIDNIKKQAKEQAYVETVTGRRIYLPHVNRHTQQGRHELRLAINAPMQGSAADIIKYAMLRITAWIKDESPDCYLLMQVHDELVFEVNRDALDKIKAIIRDFMTQAYSLSVPLVVDIGIGDNWQAAH